jgi:ribonuclease BN (tRNA processing enzyme)
MLKFLGSGSAFNTKLGNTSAYIKKYNKLLIFDCGCTVFTKIQELNLLNDVEEINVLITHTHPDHVGSLGDLVFYSFFTLKQKVNIYYPDINRIITILNALGVNNQMYNITKISNKNNLNLLGNLIYYTKTKHDFNYKMVNSYGYFLYNSNDDIYIYYSGDSCEIPNDMYWNLNNNMITHFYQDTCKADYDGNVHLSLRKLSELIPIELRNQVWCMHLDNIFDINEAKELGFNVVKNETL